MQQRTGELSDGKPVSLSEIGCRQQEPYVTSVMGCNCSICWKLSSRDDVLPFLSFFNDWKSTQSLLGEHSTVSVSLPCKRLERA
jgi:hypothetical protein